MKPSQAPQAGHDRSQVAWQIDKAGPNQALARRLLAIEFACSHPFLFVGLQRVTWRSLPSLPNFREALNAGRVWIGGLPSDRPGSSRLGPLGFCMAAASDSDLHIDELDVLPSWQNMGLASALLARLAKDAKTQGLTRLTLTTFVDVPWNAPFYAKRGFQVIAPEAGNARVASEWQRLIDKGIDPQSRCVMALEL